MQYETATLYVSRYTLSFLEGWIGRVNKEASQDREISQSRRVLQGMKTS